MCRKKSHFEKYLINYHEPSYLVKGVVMKIYLVEIIRLHEMSVKSNLCSVYGIPLIVFSFPQILSFPALILHVINLNGQGSRSVDFDPVENGSIEVTLVSVACGT